MSGPTTEAGRDYGRQSDLQDAVIEAVRRQDGVGGVKAFLALEDFFTSEARARLREELTARVEELDTGNTYLYRAPGQHGMTELLDRAAVLAIIRDTGSEG